MTSWLNGVAQTLGAAGILGCLAYLRGISKRLTTIADKQFNDELHLLAHAQRLEVLERTKS